jgi:DNA-binding transcriptional MerR regulator
MLYKIGDVAHILGISTDLIRYYEKKGVVTPIKDKSNDYRYYDTWDINYLIDCLWYKNMGFNIDHIADMVSDFSQGDLLSDISTKADELEKSIAHQQLLLQRIREYRQSVSEIKDMVGVCDIRRSPAIACYLNRYNQSYDSSARLNKTNQQWLKYMPFTKRYFEINWDDVVGGGDGYAWGFSLDMDYVEKLSVPLAAPVISFPSQLSIHSAFKSSGKNAFSPRHIDFMIDYAEANGLEIFGSVRGNLVCSIMEDDKLTGFFEVWMPIEEN